MEVILKEPKKIVPLCFIALFFLTIFFANFPYIPKILIYPIYREYKEKSLLYKSKSFKTMEGSYFRIYYKDINDRYISMIIENADKSFDILEKDFRFDIKHKISVIVYPEYSEMANETGLGNGSTAMGVYCGGVISILNPEKWVGRDYNIEEIYNKDGPMVHEITHYIIDSITKGNVPIWFTEGVALYEEYRVNNVIWAENKIYEKYYSPKMLDTNFNKLDETKAYKESFLVVEYIIKNYGITSIAKITAQLSLGKSIDLSIKKVLNINLDELFEKACSEA